MRALLQRVQRASVAIEGNVTSEIGPGFVILLGVRKGDSEADARFLAGKCASLRVMEDSGGKMNLSLLEAEGSALIVSQFTLYADTRRGNRPGFSDAAGSTEAEPLYDAFVVAMKQALGETRVRTGLFGAMMRVTIVNDGPVTILVESNVQQ